MDPAWRGHDAIHSQLWLEDAGAGDCLRALNLSRPRTPIGYLALRSRQIRNIPQDLDIGGNLPDRIRVEVRAPSGRLTRDNLADAAVVLDLLRCSPRPAHLYGS